MDLTPEQQRLREQYVIALIQATVPLQEASTDPQVTLELLIEATESLKAHLQTELQKIREEDQRD